jgi:cyclic beta-1,2-glucan synthetase
VLKYKVEPYCIAADIYSNQQHPGRGGWTWYTGSASWAYKTGIENILGLQREGDKLTLRPCIPSDWDSFTIHYRYGNTHYHITYRRPANQPQAAEQPTTIQLVDDGQQHDITIQ